MNLTLSDSLLERQRTRQWSPLVTHQFRLRHLHQLFGLNFPHLPKEEGYYYTLHLTSMSAPIYTSCKLGNSNPKWPEIDQREISNLSPTAIVLRIWQHVPHGVDLIVSTWGVNLSGLVYLGNKITEIQAHFFNSRTVIFNIRGGFFTSHEVINRSGTKPPPFIDNLNLMSDHTGCEKLFRRTAVGTCKSDIRCSYNISRLRRLQALQISIKNKRLDVQGIKDQIGLKVDKLESNHLESGYGSSLSNVRYAPQLLTMRSVNKMLEEKPTRFQRQEMVKVQNKIEVEQFRTKLLSQEKDKKMALVRERKSALQKIMDANDEKNSNLMKDYHNLKKENDKFKEVKGIIAVHQELLIEVLTKLNQRRRQLLQQLLFLYPIRQIDEQKYTIHGVCLPKSDVLSEISDYGVSIALGYITHILLMCSKVVQVPLRYPMTHCGSRSFIVDHISNFSDNDREFPLFTKGKDRIKFTYGVYLLNKNIAQLRWLFRLHTTELQATLPNLLSLLEGKGAVDMLPTLAYDFHADEGIELRSGGLFEERQRAYEARRPLKLLKNECCGGLSEILAIPEAFMNRQISSELFKNFVAMRKSDENGVAIVIKEGRFEKCDLNCDSEEAIEEGTDTLDPTLNLNDFEQSCQINSAPLPIGKSRPIEEVKESNSQPEQIHHALTARTDALLKTKSFNLVKNKSSL